MTFGKSFTSAGKRTPVPSEEREELVCGLQMSTWIKACELQPQKLNSMLIDHSSKSTVKCLSSDWFYKDL
jgi:hypothetical protein